MNDSKLLGYLYINRKKNSNYQYLRGQVNGVSVVAFLSKTKDGMYCVIEDTRKEEDNESKSKKTSTKKSSYSSGKENYSKSNYNKPSYNNTVNDSDSPF